MSKEWAAGRLELWDGWSFVLPNACMCERNRDGSWSAWDHAHTIDVQIVTIDGFATGPASPQAMLRQRTSAVVQLDGCIAEAELIEEADDEGPAFRLATQAAAVNTMMSCWIAFREPEEEDWARQVWSSIAHTPPKRRRFSRR